MAGADYVSCNECGTRLFYDGDCVARDYIENYNTTEYLICSRCYGKMLKKVSKLEKYDKRRH